MTDRILVTGAGGFIGGYALQDLHRRGYDVVAVGREAGGYGVGDSEWVAADILDTEQCRAVIRQVRPTHLLHLAWYVKHGVFWSALENFQWVKASLTLLEAFIGYGGRRAVFAGSCAEYDWVHGYCREDVTPTNPLSTYGVCKNSTRQLVEALCAARGVEWAWARIYLPYGPGEPEARLIPSAIRSLQKGSAVRCTSADRCRDFIHVEDVATALGHLLTATHRTGTFNVSSGSPTLIADVIRLCASHFENADLDLSASPNSPEDPPLLVGDNRRLKETGWIPRNTLASGVSKSVAYYCTESG